MKIAIATLYDLKDVQRGSGVFFHLARDLERQGADLYRVGPPKISIPWQTRLLGRLSRRMGKSYRSLEDPFSGKRIGAWMQDQLSRLDHDVLLTNDYCVAAFTDSQRPIALYTDAIFPRPYSSNLNPRLENLSWASVALCQRTALRGLRRSNLCIFPSRWAVEQARSYDEELASKIQILPYGSNMDDPGAEVAAERAFSKVMERGRLNLLFIGKDWQRKGGEVAVEATQELRRRGYDAVLHVVGGGGPEPLDPQATRDHGYLDKSNPQDQVTLDRLYRQADVLILPSLAEGFVVVASEAGSYGLPVVAFDTIGVNEPVRHGQTGVLLELGEPPAAFADAIEAWYSDPGSYDRLARGNRRNFEEITNWGTTAEKLLEHLTSLLGDPTTALVFREQP